MKVLVPPKDLMPVASRFRNIRCFQAPRHVQLFDIFEFQSALLEGKDSTYTSGEVHLFTIEVQLLLELMDFDNLATRLSFYYQVDGQSAAKRFATLLIVLQAVPCTGQL